MTLLFVSMKNIGACLILATSDRTFCEPCNRSAARKQWDCGVLWHLYRSEEQRHLPEPARSGFGEIVSADLWPRKPNSPAFWHCIRTGDFSMR